MANDEVAAPPSADAPKIITCGLWGGFAEWLAGLNASLAITTYQAGKVAFVGWDGQQVTLLMRQFDKPMGLAVAGKQMALATRDDVTLFADAPLLARDFLEDQPGRYDSLFLPRVTFHTGDLNVHDLAFGVEGLWIVATRFSCLAFVDTINSFVPRWRPPFVSETVPEDRCHLNGLTVVDGRPKYVTALGATDYVGGWRKEKATGGVIVDVPSGEIVTRGLSMPHSPRWHEGQLYVLNSGKGELCRVHVATGKLDVVSRLPGYLRGLCFAGPFALVGLCQIRERHIFGGLPIQQSGESLLCGVAVVELASGRMIGRFEFTAGCEEIYDVRIVAQTRRPMILNREQQASKEAFTAPDFSYWLRPSNVIEDATQTPAN